MPPNRIYLDLIKAAMRKIEPSYFNLVTTYEPSGIVRERVFCYELYHQIRLLMTDSHVLSLNGEIDKRGHRDFLLKDRKNPDFVFHIPGTNAGNTIVIEVKGKINYDDSKIKKDFITLFTFVEKYKYLSGLFILYNHSFDEFKNTYSLILSQLKLNTAAESIFIISLANAYEEPEEHTLLDI